MRRSSLAIAGTVLLSVTGLSGVPAVAASARASHAGPAPVTRVRTYDDSPGVTVVWTDPTAGFDHAVLRYARGTHAPGRHDGTGVRIAASATSATLGGLARDTDYSVTVWAVAADGRRSVPAHAHFTTDARVHGTGRYVARYTDRSGHPLAGVQAVVTDYINGDVHRATSGTDGRVSLPVPEGDVEVQSGGQHITGGSSDATGYVGTSRFVTISAGRTVDAGTIVLRPGGALQVRALDSTGSPVAGLVPDLEPVAGYVPVTGGHQEGDVFFAFSFGSVVTPSSDRTSSDGTVVVRGVPTGSAFRACAGEDEDEQDVSTPTADYRSACVPTSVVARVGRIVPAGTLTLDAQGGASIAGRVQAHGGTGFAGSDVQVSRRGHGVVADVHTGPDGTFRVGGLAAGSYQVCAVGGPFASAGATGYRPGCAGAAVVVGAAGTVASTSITLRPGAAATGTVTGPGGVPVQDAGVTVTGGGDYTFTTTDEHGQYLVRGLDAGENHICVATDSVGPTARLRYGVRGNCQRRHRSFSTRPTRIRTGINVRLGTGAALSGTVVDTAGHPVAHALVVAESQSDPDSPDASTGTRGRFTVAGLSDGPTQVCAVEPTADGAGGTYCGKAVTARAGHRVGGITITLPQTSSITVTTVDDAGHAVAGVDVVAAGRCGDDCFGDFPLLAPKAAAVDAGLVTGVRGRARLTHLVPGRYAVCALAFFGTTHAGPPVTGYADRCSGQGFDLTVRPGRTTSRRLVLHEGGEVTGRVTDAAGDPLANVLVHVAGSAADDADEDDDPTGTEGPAAYSRTAADGTFTVRSVRPGSRLVCFAPGHASGGTSTGGYRPQCVGGAVGSTRRGTPVDVTAGTTTTADITLAGAGGVSGRVSFPRGAHLAFAEVVLFRNGSEFGEDGPGSSGRFEFDQLPPGDYVVCADFSTGLQDVGRCWRDAPWSPDSSSRPPARATPVAVVAGGVTDGIDITFP